MSTFTIASISETHIFLIILVGLNKLFIQNKFHHHFSHLPFICKQGDVVLISSVRTTFDGKKNLNQQLCQNNGIDFYKLEYQKTTDLSYLSNY